MIIDNTRQRAAVLILLLGLGIAIALAPYATGLIGGVVLYVVFSPVNEWLQRRLRPSLAAALITVVALVVIVGPGISFATIILGQAQELASGITNNALLERLQRLRVGPYQVGPQIAALGKQVVTWLGSSAFGFLGTATRMVLNLVIALFVLYALAVRPNQVWEAVRGYIPFSAANAEKLRVRFRDVTTSTLIGTGLTAAIQGVLVALGFWVAGLSNALFWGVVTAVFAILPVLGSGMVWAPGALALGLGGRWGAATALALWGALVVANVDNVIRPAVFRRWAQIHPLVTLVGAVAGVSYFGILGLLIGPLAVSYFFELSRMYREEYLESGHSQPADLPRSA